MKPVVIDFEFATGLDGHPVVRCMAYHDLATGEQAALWINGSNVKPSCFDDPETVLVAFAARAELSCFIKLGWKLPDRIIDLFFLHKLSINGDPSLAKGSSLISACQMRGIDHSKTIQQKQHLQYMAIDPDAVFIEGNEPPKYNPNHRPYTDAEKQELLLYCQDDVIATSQLFLAMQERGELNHPNLFHFGDFAIAQTYIELEGQPVHRAKYECFRRNKEQIQQDAINQLLSNPAYTGIYVLQVGSKVYSWSMDGFIDFLNRERIPWPQSLNGKPNFDERVLKEKAEEYPILEPIRQCRKMVTALRSLQTDLDSDDRLRVYLSPFHTQTGRNNPSSKAFIPAMPKAFSTLLRAPEGMAIGSFDYGAQEILIMAALSADANLLADYATGDPYTAFGLQTGVMPVGATKKTHPVLRNACKTFLLAIGYGMGALSLMRRINAKVPELPFDEISARRYIRLFEDRYSTYIHWRNRAVQTGYIDREITTACGWSAKVVAKPDKRDFSRPPKINSRSVGNHPVQGTGADILHYALVLLLKHRVRVFAPVHDAIMVLAPIERILEIDLLIAKLMKQAAREILEQTPELAERQIPLPEMKVGEDGKGKDYPFGTWSLYPDCVKVDLNSPDTSGGALVRYIEEHYFAKEGL